MEKDCKAYRDCTLLQVSESDIGKELKIAGWIENIRDHGGVSFVDIRDMYGMLQVVMRDTNLLDGLNKEDCVSISGVVQQRDEETYNPKIPTGTIELEAHKVEILGKVYTQLPFEIATSKETREDLRLKYRYLDLRNRKIKDTMIFRSHVIQFLREKMIEMDFQRFKRQFFVLLLQKVQEIILYLPENIKENFMPCRKLHNNINSF